MTAKHSLALHGLGCVTCASAWRHTCALNVDSGRLVSRCSASDSVLHIVISQEVQSEAPEEGANTSGPNPAVAIAEDEHEAKTRKRDK